MKLIYLLGLVVALVPFLGIPDSWKTVLFFVIGITIFTKAYLIHRSINKLKEINSESSFKQNENFVIQNVENKEEENVEENHREEEIEIKDIKVEEDVLVKEDMVEEIELEETEEKTKEV